MGERSFYNGQTRKVEVRLWRTTAGWHVWSVDEAGDTIFFAGEEARARAEYEARVGRLMARKG